MSFFCRMCGAESEHNHGSDRNFPLCGECFRAEYFACQECREILHIENMFQEPEASGMNLCVRCHIERYTVCAECGVSHRRSEMIQTEAGIYCQQCYSSQYVACEECGCRLRRSEAVENHDGQMICNQCLSLYYYECQDCGELFHRTTATNHYGHCPDCVEQKYKLCCWCGQELIPKQALLEGNTELFVTHFDGEQVFCEECSRSYRQTGITNYSFKPFPLLYGDRESRHYGIELEVDLGGCRHENADAIKEIANREAINIYTKSDGSINDGFEIVTHPMTYGYITGNMPWKEMFEKLVSMGYRSHQTSTCGLHIHVERESFGQTQDEQESVLSSIVFFVEKHWDQILDFSRRTKHQVEQWANRYGVKSAPMELLDIVKAPSNRYSCVNLLPTKTIEFRIFRGTLKLGTFLATIQLVDEICKQAMLLTHEEMTDLSWKKFVMGIDMEEKPELVAYLKERQLYVNELVRVAAGGEEF